MRTSAGGNRRRGIDMAFDYIAIDFETANTYANSACSVGLVRFIGGKETDSVHSLIPPAKMHPGMDGGNPPHQLR